MVFSKEDFYPLNAYSDAIPGAKEDMTQCQIKITLEQNNKIAIFLIATDILSAAK
jgi:hypothetical protein